MKKTSQIAKCINKIIKIILLIMISLILLYNIANIVNGGEYISIMGYSVFVVQQHQEQKNIEKDTIIITKKIKEKYEVNDLVAIRKSNTVFFHRIIETKNGDLYITKGDGNYREDEKAFHRDKIEGKVIKKIGKFGKVLNIVQSKIFSIIILVLSILFFRYNKRSYLKKIKRRLKQKSVMKKS